MEIPGYRYPRAEKRISEKQRKNRMIHCVFEIASEIRQQHAAVE